MSIRLTKRNCLTKKQIVTSRSQCWPIKCMYLGFNCRHPTFASQWSAVMIMSNVDDHHLFYRPLAIIICIDNYDQTKKNPSHELNDNDNPTFLYWAKKKMIFTIEPLHNMISIRPSPQSTNCRPKTIIVVFCLFFPSFPRFPQTTFGC